MRVRKNGLKACKTRITINISGEIFETYEETLSLFPTTLLGDKRRRRKHYCVRTDQYFFDRNRLCFESILQFYQSKGTLNCPLGVSLKLFEEECQYFKIPKETLNEMQRKEGIFPELLAENQTDVKHLPFRARVWNMLEAPNTSPAAWYFGMVSLTCVWLSILTASVETLSSFQPHSKVWGYIELVLNVWFMLELILRIAFSSNVILFFKGYMNIVDILAVLPYFLLLVQKNQSFEKHDHQEQPRVIGLLQSLKFLRVCRLVRFSKHSKRLAVAAKILHSCFGSFRLLLLCMFIVITMGSTVMNIVEEVHTCEHFDSIPASLWWGVQTITSVGYGDMIPRTLVGRIFASCYMLLGVATISLPILTIVNQFVRLYPINIEMEAQGGEEHCGGATNGKANMFRGQTPSKRIR